MLLKLIKSAVLTTFKIVDNTQEIKRTKLLYSTQLVKTYCLDIIRYIVEK